MPCGRPVASTRKLTPPGVCQARTVPIDWPAELTSAIGAPPCGRSVTQPASGAAAAAAKADVTNSTGRMCYLNTPPGTWFRSNCEDIASVDDDLVGHAHGRMQEVAAVRLVGAARGHETNALGLVGTKLDLPIRGRAGSVWVRS